MTIESGYGIGYPHAFQCASCTSYVPLGGGYIDSGTSLWCPFCGRYTTRVVLERMKDHEFDENDKQGVKDD